MRRGVLIMPNAAFSLAQLRGFECHPVCRIEGLEAHLDILRSPSEKRFIKERSRFLVISRRMLESWANNAAMGGA